VNIAFYRYSLFNRGGDRLSLAYANHLASVGHDVTMYVKESATSFAVSPALKIRAVNCSGRAGFLYFAARHHLGHDVVVVDIIHLHFLLSRHNRVIYYAQADDVEYYDNPLARKLIEFLYKLHFGRHYPMISMSQHLTDIFTNRYGARGVFTLATGIDHSLFYPDGDEELVSPRGDKRAVVFMSRGDAYRKGFDVAMSVFASLEADIGQRMELWVCGDPLAQEGFCFTIRNFGVVTDDRLRQLLSSADIFFYPSRHEGFGLFPLEAMACGCVAVTTDAIPYARGTDSMLVSPVGDQAALKSNLTRLIKDGALLEELRLKALQDARSYDFEKSKTAFEKVIKTIVAGFES